MGWAGQVGWWAAVVGLGEEAVGLVCKSSAVRAASGPWRFGGLARPMTRHLCIARSQLFGLGLGLGPDLPLTACTPWACLRARKHD